MSSSKPILRYIPLSHIIGPHPVVVPMAAIVSQQRYDPDAGKLTLGAVENLNKLHPPHVVVVEQKQFQLVAGFRIYQKLQMMEAPKAWVHVHKCLLEKDMVELAAADVYASSVLYGLGANAGAKLSAMTANLGPDLSKEIVVNPRKSRGKQV